jgi:hypothetical protein|tara:strand:- start:20128 stop:20835 length:708 start_codon:yes stop_codon:yes gene_type:complete
LSETHNDVPTRLRIHVQGGNAATAQSVIDGLRRGLVDTHRIEEVAFQVDTLSAEVSLDLRLIGIQAATVPEIAARLSEPAGRTRRMEFQCSLLDQLGVPNGTKAISIALVAHWSDEHRRLYGEHDNPCTIKRWRIERSRPARHGDFSRRDRRRTPSELDQVRAKFAAHTVCNGMRFVDGYSAAIHEVEMINSGAHPNCPRPEVQLARFSYATFARDCRTVERRLGRVPGWRRRAG